MNARRLRWSGPPGGWLAHSLAETCTGRAARELETSPGGPPYDSKDVVTGFSASTFEIRFKSLQMA